MPPHRLRKSRQFRRAIRTGVQCGQELHDFGRFKTPEQQLLHDLFGFRSQKHMTRGGMLQQRVCHAVSAHRVEALRQLMSRSRIFNISCVSCSAVSFRVNCYVLRTQNSNTGWCFSAEHERMIDEDSRIPS